MNILAEISKYLFIFSFVGTFVAMVIHTNKLVTRKKLSNAYRFFVLAGVLYPIVSIGTWIAAILAGPGNKDQRLKKRLIPNILAGTVLSFAILILFSVFKTMDNTLIRNIPLEEIDFNKMHKNLGAKFDPKNATVDTAFYENPFRSSYAYYKFKLNDEEKTKFANQIKKSPGFIFKLDTTYQVVQDIENWKEIQFLNTLDSLGNPPNLWIQKNDSVFIFHKSERSYSDEIWSKAQYNSNNGVLYYNVNNIN